MIRAIVSLAVALAFFASSASAQPTWELELLGGFNVSQLTGDDTSVRVFFDDVDLGTGTVTGDIGSTKAGLVAGGLTTVFFNDNVGLQTGLLWARRGGDGEITLQGDIPGIGLVDLTFDITMTLDYFEIPLLAVFAVPAGQSATVRFLAGPTFAFNSKAELEMSLAGFSDTEDIGEIIKGADFGGLLGAGVAFPVGSVSIVVDARYSMGFTSIDDTDADIDWKNSAFTMLAGVAVPIGPR